MSKQHPMDAARGKVELAETYADDGAFFSCARCLREAADLVEQHARNCRAAEDEYEAQRLGDINAGGVL